MLLLVLLQVGAVLQCLQWCPEQSLVVTFVGIHHQLILERCMSVGAGMGGPTRPGQALALEPRSACCFRL